MGVCEREREKERCGGSEHTLIVFVPREIERRKKTGGKSKKKKH